VAQIPKILNPFTHTLAPPFIGRRRDFYILKTHSSSKNILNVNTYKNVFFISHIYKSATSSHSKPGLFGTTTLTLLLTGSWISPFATFEPDFWQIPEFSVFRSSWLRRLEIPDFRVFMTPRFCRFKIPENRMFATPRLRKSKFPENRMFATPRLRRSKIPENRKCLQPASSTLISEKTSTSHQPPANRRGCISRASLNSMFRGWRTFVNSPTTVYGEPERVAVRAWWWHAAWQERRLESRGCSGCWSLCGAQLAQMHPSQPGSISRIADVA
jgi:hypothetical protein